MSQTIGIASFVPKAAIAPFIPTSTPITVR
jgi:hypothetical protein